MGLRRVGRGMLEGNFTLIVEAIAGWRALYTADPVGKLFFF
jgi:hypothetical protein